MSFHIFRESIVALLNALSCPFIGVVFNEGFRS